MEMVKQGNTWMDEADSFMHSMTAIENDRGARKMPESQETDVVRPGDILYHGPDIRESLEDDSGSRKELSTASEELHQNKVDGLKVVKLAREANDSADKILIQARSERLVCGRMRSVAASSCEILAPAFQWPENIYKTIPRTWEMKPGIF
jgi:hypothetical protein